jgi:hypothetical protein
MSTIDDVPKWAFPDVRYLVEDKIGEYNISYQLRIYEDKIAELENTLLARQSEIECLNAKLMQMAHDTEQLQYQNVKAIDGIRESLTKINEGISQDALQVIKMVTKKILLRELKTDDVTLKGIVENILSKVISDDLIQVEVCERDFQLLGTAQFKNPTKIVMNTHLNPGDILVSCQSGGVMLKLDEAINSVLGS